MATYQGQQSLSSNSKVKHDCARTTLLSSGLCPCWGLLPLLASSSWAALVGPFPTSKASAIPEEGDLGLTTSLMNRKGGPDIRGLSPPSQLRVTQSGLGRGPGWSWTLPALHLSQGDRGSSCQVSLFTLCKMGWQAGGPRGRGGGRVLKGWLLLLLSLALQSTQPPPDWKHRDMPQPNLPAHLIIILRARKPPPGDTRGTQRPSVPSPRPSRPAPTLCLSNMTGPGTGSMCTLSGSAALPLFHPSSGWGSGLAREAVEGN